MMIMDTISLTLYHINLNFNDLPIQKTLKNIEGKGENAGNQHFLLFPQCFLPNHKQIDHLSYI